AVRRVSHSLPTRRSSDLDEALAHERAMLAAADGSPGMVWSLWQTGSCIVVPRSHTVRPGFGEAVAASAARGFPVHVRDTGGGARSEEHTSELQSRDNLVC